MIDTKTRLLIKSISTSIFIPTCAGIYIHVAVYDLAKCQRLIRHNKLIIHKANSTILIHLHNSRIVKLGNCLLLHIFISFNKYLIL